MNPKGGSGRPKPSKIGKTSTPKNSKEQTAKSWCESRFGPKNALLLRSFLLHFLCLGPSWDQNGPEVLPREPPGRFQALFSVDFL